jgi:hypothetical protein
MENEDIQKIRSEALSFLKDHKIAVLATAKPDGTPHAATVYYVVDDEFNIYFVTDSRSEKGQNISNNNKVGIAIGFGPEISTMQGGGTIIEGDTPYSPVEILGMIGHRLDQKEKRYWPVVKLNMTSWQAYKIKLDWLTWLNMDIENAPANVYKESFHKVI